MAIKQLSDRTAEPALDDTFFQSKNCSGLPGLLNN